MYNFLTHNFKKYFATGLLVLGPIGLTVLVVQNVVGWLDSVLYQALPVSLQLEKLIGMKVPGLGIATGLVFVLLVGVLAANVLGRFFVNFFEKAILKIPLVKSIYTLFKEVADTTFGRNRKGFRKVVLIEYPRKGLWALGFVTGVAEGEIQRLTKEKVINVFLPTTPNPTSGFYILVPEKDSIQLSMSVDDAFRLIISGGMSVPPDKTAPPVLDCSGDLPLDDAVGR